MSLSHFGSVPQAGSLNLLEVYFISKIESIVIFTS